MPDELVRKLRHLAVDDDEFSWHYHQTIARLQAADQRRQDRHVGVLSDSDYYAATHTAAADDEPQFGDHLGPLATDLTNHVGPFHLGDGGCGVCAECDKADEHGGICDCGHGETLREP